MNCIPCRIEIFAIVTVELPFPCKCASEIGGKMLLEVIIQMLCIMVDMIRSEKYLCHKRCLKRALLVVGGLVHTLNQYSGSLQCCCPWLL